MRICCVPMCNKLNRHDKTRSFHEFPCHLEAREKWIRVVSRLDPQTKELWQPSDKSVVCSKHFLETDFKVGTKHRVLKPNVVPTVFPHYPTYMQREAQKYAQKRKPPMQRLPLPPAVQKKPKKDLVNGEACGSGISKPKNTAASRFKDVAVQVVPQVHPVDCGVQVNSLGRAPLTLAESRKKLRASQRMNCNLRRKLNQLKDRLVIYKKKAALYNKYPIGKVMKLAKAGNVHCQFLLEQLQVHNKDRKRVRFSDKTLEFCHTWKQYCSSRSYEYVRRVGLLELPSHRTLLRHQLAIDAAQEEAAKQKKEAANALLDETIESVVRNAREEATAVSELTESLIEISAEGVSGLEDIRQVFHDFTPGQVFYVTTPQEGDSAEKSTTENDKCEANDPTPTSLMPTVLQVFANDHCYYGSVPTLPCSTEPIPTQLPPHSLLLEQLLTTGVSNCGDFG